MVVFSCYKIHSGQAGFHLRKVGLEVHPEECCQFIWMNREQMLPLPLHPESCLRRHVALLPVYWLSFDMNLQLVTHKDDLGQLQGVNASPEGHFWSFLGHPDKVQQSFSIGMCPVEIF